MDAHSFPILLNDGEKQYMKIKLIDNRYLETKYINPEEICKLQEL